MQKVKDNNSYLVYTVIKKCQACILIANKGALLNKADEHLSFGHEGVELLIGAIAALQEPCREQEKLILVSLYGICTIWHSNGCTVCLGILLIAGVLCINRQQYK